MSKKEIVLTHPEMGIYVGTAIGLGFWSNWDAAGQNTAPTFESEQQARNHVRTWDTLNDDTQYSYVEVEIDDIGHYATIDQLRAAGLSNLLGELLVTNLYKGTA